MKKSLTKYLNAFLFDVLGLELPTQEKGSDGKLEQTIDLLLNLREEARLNKDFDLSDNIRDRLQDIGVQLKDTPEGTAYTIE